MNILKVDYWISSRNINDIKIKLDRILTNNSLFFNNNKNLENFIFLILYIRDKDYGLGLKDISRWMLLELELIREGVIKSLFEVIPIFGYWKDFNLILMDIYGNNKYKVLENQIYDYLKQSLIKDLNNYNKGYNISFLVKYIGKERKSLDKKTGFTRRFALDLFPEKNLFMALKEFRIICRNLNKFKETEKNNNNNKMKSDVFKNTKIKFDKILYNINNYPKYRRSKRSIDHYILTTDEIYNIKYNKPHGNYIYHDRLIKTLDNVYDNINILDYKESPSSLSNLEEFIQYQSLFNENTYNTPEDDNLFYSNHKDYIYNVDTKSLKNHKLENINIFEFVDKQDEEFVDVEDEEVEEVEEVEEDEDEEDQEDQEDEEDEEVEDQEDEEVEDEEYSYLENQKKHIKHDAILVLLNKTKECLTNIKTVSINQIPYNNIENINIKVNKINLVENIKNNKLNIFMMKWKTNSKIRLFNTLSNNYITFCKLTEIRLLVYRYKNALLINKFINKHFSNKLITDPVTNSSFSILNYLFNSFKTSNIYDNNITELNKVDTKYDNEDFILINMEDLAVS